MAAVTRSITLPAKVDALRDLQREVEIFSEEAGVGPALAMELDLILEELVSNIIKYAFPDERKGDISLSLECCANGIVMELRDAGQAFDPTVADTPNTTCSLEDRCIGGLGIHLVRNMVDTMRYERRDGINVLWLQKGFAPRCGTDEASLGNC
jgi:anti-sigma regulatory factor (Ser/Thr protein kinase)